MSGQKRAITVATGFAAALVIALLPPALPATAQDSRCSTDVAGDVKNGFDPAQYPPADILEFCDTWSSSALTLTMRTQQPLDPTTDPAWAGSALTFDIYPLGNGDGPGGNPVEVSYHVVNGQIVVRVRPIVFADGEDFECFGQGSFADGAYVAVVPWNCIQIDDRLSIRSIRTVFRPDGNIFNDVIDHSCCAPPPPAAPSPPPQEPAPEAPPATPGKLTQGARLDGGGAADPVGQAVATSQHLFADGTADRVVLATADRFPDALAGAALAGTLGPVLFTTGLGELDARVADEIARVTGGDGVVLVLGGRAAVSDVAADQARASGGDRPCVQPMPEDCRFAGSGREETAVMVAEVVAAEHPSTSATVLVARSDNFADALTGGALAARRGMPILLTPTDLAHPATVAFLERHQAGSVLALGGAAAISDETLAALPAGARGRIAGPERTATAAAVAGVWRDLGYGEGGVVLVNVRDPRAWQTALAASVASAIFDAPQIGVESPPAPISPAATQALSELSRPVQAFGDVSLVDDRQLADAAAEAN